MIAQQSGDIINISSAGLAGNALTSATAHQNLQFSG
jgi:hypothetical protein